MTTRKNINAAEAIDKLVRAEFEFASNYFRDHQGELVSRLGGETGSLAISPDFGVLDFGDSAYVERLAHDIKIKTLTQGFVFVGTYSQFNNSRMMDLKRYGDEGLIYIVTPRETGKLEGTK